MPDGRAHIIMLGSATDVLKKSPNLVRGSTTSTYRDALKGTSQVVRIWGENVALSSLQ